MSTPSKGSGVPGLPPSPCNSPYFGDAGGGCNTNSQCQSPSTWAQPSQPPDQLPVNVNACSDDPYACSPNGAVGTYGINGQKNAIDRASDASTTLGRLQEPLQLSVPIGAGCCGKPSAYFITQSLNYLIKLAHPDGGPFDPGFRLTYNSVNASSSSPYGKGWAGTPIRRISITEYESGSTVRAQQVQITSGNGAQGTYTNPDNTTGLFAASGIGWNNQLFQLPSDNSFMEVQPDSSKFFYDPTGVMTAMANSAGVLWTYTYDMSGRVSSITSPFNRISTFIYGTSGSNSLIGFWDPANRITTLTINSTIATMGHLIQAVSPELCVTSFLYNQVVGSAPDDLNVIVRPDGAYITLTYDASDRPGTFTTPGNRVTTITYPTSRSVQVTNPRGFTRIVTLTNVVNQGTFFANMADALGNVYTITSAPDLSPGTFIDPLNNRTTLSYTTIPSMATTLLGAVTDAAGNSFTYTYDNSGNMIGLQDQVGNRSTMQWDGSGHRTLFIDSLNHRTTYAYNSNGQMTSITDPLGRLSTMVYDAAGLQVASIDPRGFYSTNIFDSGTQLRTGTTDANGATTRFYRDSMNRVTMTVDPLGRTTTTTYDTLGRVTGTTNPAGETTLLYYQGDDLIAVRDPLGNYTSYTYDLNGNRVTTTDPMNRVVTYSYDALDRLVSETNPSNDRTTFSYDAVGNRIAVMNPILNITTTVYDGKRRPTAVVNPLSKTETVTYDGVDNITVLTDRLGRLTTMTYDSLYRLVAVTDALQQIVTSSYDFAGQRVSQTNQGGFTTTYTYDKAGNITSTVNPLSKIWTYQFDSVNQPVSTTNPLLQTTSVVYDLAGQRIAFMNPAGSRTTTVYDLAGRPIAKWDANNNRTTISYDALGRPVTEKNALNSVATRLYDPVSRLTAAVDARGNTTTFDYNDATRRTVITDPLNNRTTNVLDPAGQPYYRIDARSYVTTYTFDSASRLVGRQYPDSTRVTFTYDDVGNRTLSKNYLGTYTSTFDSLNRLSTFTDVNGKSISYQYEPRGFRSIMTDPDAGVFSYSYDNAGRARSLINPEADRSTWIYDDADQSIGLVMANGVRTSWTYDTRGWLNSVANLNSGGTTLSSFLYSLDNVGNKTSVVEMSGDRVTWTYDNAYQLTRERRSGTGAYDVTYTYDAVGNRLNSISSGSVSTYAYDKACQLNSVASGTGTRSLTFDANGNLATYQASPGAAITTILWDFENRLAQYSVPGSFGIKNDYDPEGHRVQIQLQLGGGPFTPIYKYFWDRENILLQLDNSAVTLQRFSYLPKHFGDLISLLDSGQPLYFTFDGIGSTVQTIESNGSQDTANIYGAFGTTIQSGSGAPFRFVGLVGYWEDGISAVPFLYIRRRWYSPVEGRWTSKDPEQLYATITSPYNYVDNRVLYAKDPQGLEPEADGGEQNDPFFDPKDYPHIFGPAETPITPVPEEPTSPGGVITVGPDDDKPYIGGAVYIPIPGTGGKCYIIGGGNIGLDDKNKPVWGYGLGIGIFFGGGRK